ncbi:MAG: hypothetical protein KC729_02850 [Candidatus Eisenbacteria bacterium]|uniref:Outer membrane protein beta-barrel domain-containing protein n=1 Tax=Eiseniibacteriota bacterium TaxID=2212470 RepID=A0A956LXW1_UNCEI|nr:hypothetical protein [Candidatus Eisenbacteria bacterium]
MNRMVVIALVGTLVGCLGSVAQAAPFAPTQRLALSGQAGLGSIGMKDVNAEIDRGNTFLQRQTWSTLDDLKSNFLFRGDLRYNIYGSWSVSAGISRAVASTGVDFDQVIEVKPSATIYRGAVSYQLPWWVKEKIRFALGGGIDRTSSARVEVSHEHRNVESGTIRIETLTLEGSGTGAHAFLESELLVSESISLVSDIGWRQLKVSTDSFRWKIERVENPDLDQDRDDVPNGSDLSDNSFLRHGFLPPGLVGSPGDIRILEPDKVDMDFSGVQASVGLRFYLF